MSVVQSADMPQGIHINVANCCMEVHHGGQISLQGLHRYLPGRGVGVPGGGSPLAFRTTGILMYVHFLFCQTFEKVIPQMLPLHGGGFLLCLQYTPERIVPLRLRTLATSKTRLCDPASRCTYQYQGPLTVGLLREPV